MKLLVTHENIGGELDRREVGGDWVSGETAEVEARKALLDMIRSLPFVNDGDIFRVREVS